MKRTLIIFISLALLSAASLSEGGFSSQQVAVIDEEGRTVSVALSPERIVCLTPAAAEVIYALDEADRLVALSDDCTIPPALLEKERVGRSGREADVERIMELSPGLVIAKTGGLFSREHEEQLTGYGVPVLRYRALSIDTLIPMIEDLGLILEREEEAKDMVEYLEEYAELVLSRTAGIPQEDRPGVYFMSMGRFDWTAGSDSTGHDRIVAAGGRNLAEDLLGKVPHVEMEWVIERNPEVIVYSIPSSQYQGTAPTPGEMAGKRDEIMALAGFTEIDAVKAGRVYIVDINMASGLAEVVNMLYYARWFHPHLFEDIDPRGVYEEIHRRYFDMGMEGVSQVYPEGAAL
ncbi:MAG: Periplasmic binding protein [Methanothrix sp.]|jgi:iron complex transport system substrate-binding protein|nr:MAG: Periplasmic binding protein [Methanothrix sp.]